MPRREPPNPFARSWKLAKEQGMSRKGFAEAVDIPRGRLNDLILGRKRPSLGETTKLTGKRRATLVRYQDVEGNVHGYYTGRGMSLERLLETGELPEIAAEQSEGRYAAFAGLAEARPRFPNNPAQTRIYSVSRFMRRQFDANT